MKDAVARLLRQLLPGRVELELAVLRKGLDLLEAPVIGPFFPDSDGAPFDGLGGIGNDLLFVDFQEDAEA